jgi:hypothetical protein
MVSSMSTIAISPIPEITGCRCQADQEPGGGRVELEDMPGPECPKDKLSVDGGVRSREHLPDPAVVQQRHIVDLSTPATIPASSKATFNSAFAPLFVGTVTCSSATARSPAESASATTETSPADDTRFGSSNTADDRPHTVRRPHLPDALSSRWVRTLDKSDLPAAQGHPRVTARTPITSVGPGLVRAALPHRRSEPASVNWTPVIVVAPQQSVATRGYCRHARES